MSCVYNNPLNNTNPSELHGKLLEVFNESEANTYWALTQTPEFIEKFGDWRSDFNKGTRLFGNRTYQTGEPMLMTNLLGQPYFLLQDGSKLFLKRRLLNYTHEDREFLVNFTMFQLFGQNLTTDYEAFENVDIRQIFTDKGDDERTTIYQMLGGNMVDLRDVYTLVKDRLKELKAKVIEREDLHDGESDITMEDSENGKMMDLTSSTEKNSKDNATSNIKFLLSFIPVEVTRQEMNEEGVMEEVTMTEFAKFSQVWTKIEPVLANTINYYNNGIVISKYQTMVERLKLAYPNDPLITQVLETLEKMSDYKKNEFVHAFDKIKKDFQTNLLTKTKEGVRFRSFSSDSAVTPEKKSINAWSANFKNTTIINVGEDGKPVYNQAKANTLSVRLAEAKNKLFELNKSNPNGPMNEESYIKLKEALNFVGITIDHNALRDYIFNSIEHTNDNLTNSMLFATYNKLDHIFKNLAKLKTEDVVNGLNVKNVFNLKNFGQVKELAFAQARYNQDLTENTIMGPQSKKYWIYSMPSYIENKMDRLINDTASELPLANAFYGNSIILERFRERLEDPNKHSGYIANIQLKHFNNFREDSEGVSDEGTDNSGMQKADQLTHNINIVLEGKKDPTKATYYTPIPADKSSLVHIQGTHFFSTVDSNDAFSINQDVIKIFEGYLIDELNRIQEELNIIADPETNKNRIYKDYHYHYVNGEIFYYGIPIPGKPNKYDYVTDPNTKGAVPVGNAFKSILFPQFSPFNQSPEVEAMNLFNTKGRLLQNVETLRGNETVQKIINDTLSQVVTTDFAQLEAEGLITKDGEKFTFKALDAEIMGKYRVDFQNVNQAVRAAVSDYVVNSLIANVEYSKVFSGDYAFYKDLPDLSKRYPATYTDGINLNLRVGDPSTFKLSVLPNIRLPSYAIEQMRVFSSELADAYNDINAADAQGYITLARWKFIMERSNHWNPKFDKAYERMKSGKPTVEDYKLAAQPIKGVHFEVIDGVPTYVKYSAAVLIPNVVKNTDLGKLLDDMTSQGIDEAVVIDGLKVGAKLPSNVLGENGVYTPTKLNTITLRNNNYKIQQDLRPKGIKMTLLGSQIKKTILTNFKDDEEYSGILGKDLKQEIFDILSAKSDLGLKRVQSALGINNEGQIVNKEKLIQTVRNKIADKGLTENLASALEREFDFDYIANYRQKIQNSLFAIINDETIKVKTNGASFIQMSSWGLNTDQVKNSGIKLLVDDFKALKPPVVTSTFSKVTTQNVVSFGDFKIDVNIGPDTLITPIIVNGKTIGEVGISFSNWVTLDSRNNDESKLPDSTTFKSKEVFISGVEIYEEFKNKGFGKEAYKELINKLGEKGFYINSGINTSDEAKRVWDSLVRDNIATLNKNEYSTKDLFKKKVTPGQVFVTSNYIAKFIPDWKDLPPAELKKRIDSRLLKMIGYRIPNQGMSSNSSLEIVGILPESMGDVIIPYIDITTQTGSDFDIDKMYVMIPNAKAVYSTKSINEYVSDLMQMDLESMKDIMHENGWTDAKLDELTAKNKNDESKKKTLAYLIVEEGLHTGVIKPERLSESAIRLDYVEYDKSKPLDQQKETAIDNRLMELMQIILEDEKTYEALMTPLDNPFLKDDINKLHKDADSGVLGANFFSPMYQINKKFDNSGGKTGVGLTANQLVDHMWTQHVQLTYDGNLGFTRVDPATGNTTFGAEFDILGENRITDVLSWFLTAYVDIAKDPYITKGNHNEFTSNTTFMLLRAGAPISFINRLVGQPIVKKLAEIDSLRKSRIADRDTRDINDAVKEELGIVGESNKTAQEIIDKYIESDNKEEFITRFNKQLEKDITEPNLTDPQWQQRQLQYLELYNHYHKIGKDFGKLVLSSKQDVNGGGKDFISAYTDRNKRTEANSLAFNGFMAKFNGTFLGTAYNNSTELGITLMEQLFVTSNKTAQGIYDTIYSLIVPNSKFGLVEPKLGFEMEKAYFAHILGQTGMARTNAEIRDMFIGNNTVYDRMLKIRKNLPDNYLLKMFKPDTIDNLKFITIDSTRNSTTEGQNEYSRAWEDLINSADPEVKQLGLDLIVYSFYQSGFRSNIGSFFEHIPTDPLRDMVEGGILQAKQSFAGGNIGINQFVDKFFRNNYQNNRLVPFVSDKATDSKGKTRELIVSNILTVLSNGGTEIGKESMPYVKTSAKDGSIRLWKNMGYRFDSNRRLTESKFIEVSKLGYRKNGRTIFEYTSDIPVDGDSMWEANNVKPATAQIQAIQREINAVKMMPYTRVESVVNDIKLQENNRDQKKDMGKGLDDGTIKCTGGN
jgi:hypothetical protein